MRKVNPDSLFSKYLCKYKAAKCFPLTTPVIISVGWKEWSGTISVPGFSGLLVFLTLIGTFPWIAGINASSWNTEKPA